MDGINAHAEVFMLVELPFALNDVNLRVSVPIPSDFLHAEDASTGAAPQVHLTVTNLNLDATGPAGGEGLIKFATDVGALKLAAEIANRVDHQGLSRSLVQARTIACRLDGEDDYPSDEAAALERVIYALNRLIHAYLIAFEDDDAHFISREHLFAPVLISPVAFGKDLSQARVMGPPGRSLRFRPRAVVDDELLRLDSAAGIEPLDHPIDAARLWLLDARRSRQAGDGDHAIVALQTSAERLLFGAHQLILIDEGLNADELLACQLATPFKSLLTRELPGRLKGRWQLDGNGAVAKYWRELYEARNAIIHAGYRLHRQHVDAAFGAYDELEAHLIDRTIARKHKYPRLAFGLLGAPGLERRGAMSNQLREWARKIRLEALPFWLPPSQQSAGDG